MLEALKKEVYEANMELVKRGLVILSLIHISEPTRRTPISYAVFCLKKKKKKKNKKQKRKKTKKKTKTR